MKLKNKPKSLKKKDFFATIFSLRINDIFNMKLKLTEKGINSFHNMILKQIKDNLSKEEISKKIMMDAHRYILDEMDDTDEMDEWWKKIKFHTEKDIQEAYERIRTEYRYNAFRSLMTVLYKKHNQESLLNVLENDAYFEINYETNYSGDILYCDIKLFNEYEYNYKMNKYKKSIDSYNEWYRDNKEAIEKEIEKRSIEKQKKIEEKMRKQEARLLKEKKALEKKLATIKDKM